MILKNKIIKYSIINGFLISPLLFFPMIICEMINNKKYAYFLFTIFLSLLAYLIPPKGDLYRYWMFYNWCVDCDFVDIWGTWSLDFVLYFILFVFAKLGINFSFIQFLLVFVETNILIYLIRCITKERVLLNDFVYFESIITFLFLSGFWFNFETARFYLALHFFIFGLYCLFNKMNLGVIFFVLSIITHFSFSIFILIYVISLFIYKYINRINIILFVLFVNFFLGCLKDFDYLADMPIVSHYLFNRSNYLENNSFLLFFFVVILSVFPLWILISYYFLNNNRDKKTKIVLVFISVTFSLSQYVDIFIRFSIVTLYISMLVYLMNFKNNIAFRKWSRLLFLSSIIALTSCSLIQYRTLQISRLYFLLTPFPVSLYNKYDIHWIDDNYDNGCVI